MFSTPINEVPHTLYDQLKSIHNVEKAIMHKRHNQELENDQSDITFALGSDNAWAGHRERLIMPVDGSE